MGRMQAAMLVYYTVMCRHALVGRAVRGGISLGAIRWCIVLAAVVGCVLPALSAADEPTTARRQHPWGCCPAGSWKSVQVITQSLDASGRVVHTTITETRTTLNQIDDRGMSLDVQSFTELAGRRLDSPLQTIRQAFVDESDGPGVKVRSLGVDVLTIEDRKIPVKVDLIESASNGSKTATKIYHSDSIAPFVLKRQSVTTDGAGKETLGETSTETVSLDMPFQVLSEIKSVAEVRTLTSSSNGVISTLAFVAADVPGGVVCHTSKELDKSGRVVRRSVLTVTGYGLEPDDDRGLFRKRRSSSRKTTSHP